MGSEAEKLDDQRDRYKRGQGCRRARVTLAYHGGEKTISIAHGAPVVTFAPATPADSSPAPSCSCPATRR